MKWLPKKPRDPLSERQRELERELARVQRELQRLSQEQTYGAAPSQETHAPRATVPQPDRPKTEGPRPRPRLRSTTLPGRGQAVRPAQAAGGEVQESLFDDADQTALKKNLPPPKPVQELGVRKTGLAALWESLRRYFRGRPASNPRLVNYLAAGSIEGLPPLRYEKRIARNQFIAFAVVLALLLWGLIALLMRGR